MSMSLYALCLHPLHTLFSRNLAALKIGKKNQPTAAVAYADDITLIITVPNDLLKVRDIINSFEKASGVVININKSKALAIAGWDDTDTRAGFKFCPQLKILGTTFISTKARSSQLSWEPITKTIRAQAKLVYARNLNLTQRIQYVNSTLLARIWYLAQIFPPLNDLTNKMSTAINWYIWQGKIFRVPTATIQKRKLQGGWGLVDIGVKCKSLLINRLWKEGCKEDSATAAWLKYWNLAGSQGNPPNRLGKLQNMKYLLIYAYNMAYISPQSHNEKANAFQKRIYDSLYKMERAGLINIEPRISRQQPQADWNRVWENLHSAPFPEQMKATWYHIIHDLVPTKSRLAAIQLSALPQCDRCNKLDTIVHRLTNCSNSARIWRWTSARLAMDQRTTGADATDRHSSHSSRMDNETRLSPVASTAAPSNTMDNRPPCGFPGQQKAPYIRRFY